MASGGLLFSTSGRRAYWESRPYCGRFLFARWRPSRQRRHRCPRRTRARESDGPLSLFRFYLWSSRKSSTATMTPTTGYWPVSGLGRFWKITVASSLNTPVYHRPHVRTAAHYSCPDVLACSLGYAALRWLARRGSQTIRLVQCIVDGRHPRTPRGIFRIRNKPPD